MFTGIIQAIGTISQRQSTGPDAKLYIRTHSLNLQTVQLGDSIAVNGVCLTVTSLPKDGFWADVSGETLSRTTLGELSTGSEVNLETALTLQTPLGGHLVSGHVDGVGILTQLYNDGRSLRLHIQTPPELVKYIAPKGSICVDGISLTVNAITDTLFTLNLVPHTLAMTTLKAAKIGQRVNLEVDIIARYLERLLLATPHSSPSPPSLTQEFLQRHGFA